MPQVFNIAPRVLVYPHGTTAPAVEEGWLALPQLSAATAPSLPSAAALVSSTPAGSGAARFARPEPLAVTSNASAPSLGAAPPSPGCAVTPPPGGSAPRSAGTGAATARAVFGDGSHPTTRLCAAAVDLLCRQRPGMAVLDVGAGTGILARIARARGATFVAATDIDPAAIACAKAHAELDLLAWRGAPSGARQFNIHFGAELPDHWGARFDLIVANILEAPLRSLAPALCRALVPGGVLVISGFTRPQVPALRLVYKTAGLQSAGDFSLDEWVLLKFAAPTHLANRASRQVATDTRQQTTASEPQPDAK
jgi:2-polyprenyl-3-methyl-5-hydroxy-6-metoxy-1,4-benzoquinol methylase